jgi:phenylpropionate dioxygenase-like ring-hydroxylating dioxygenase large terminal subunit
MNGSTLPAIDNFNNPDRFIQGWYWAIASQQLKIGQVKAVNLLGRDLVIYRSQQGLAIALDAYCPHMGAHLAEGRVEGEEIRCMFHNWKFDRQGVCVEIPCLDRLLPVQVKSWSVGERYGLVWVWTGDAPPQPLPYVPELKDVECAAMLGSTFVKNCHPNVVLINAIDAHHFNTVHNFPVEIVFEQQEIDRSATTFSNITRGGKDSWLVKLIQPFYKNAGTYSMCYWYGSTGTVTLGPDFLHFYIMFALRMLEGGKTEGQTVLITPKRSGIFGWIFNRLVLWITQLVGNYFAKGDTQIFQTINFNLQTPTPADRSILQFIHHVDRQQPAAWKSWEPIAGGDTSGCGDGATGRSITSEFLQAKSKIQNETTNA